MARKGKGNNKNRITNVRMVDEYAGTDGLRTDRMLSSLDNSQNQVRVLCTTTFEITTTSSGADISGYYAAPQVRSTDDFVSMSEQFELYRITAIRFDVYDINPNTAVAHAFSTFHLRSTGDTLNFPFGDVIDSPDSQVIPPGTGKAHFTWVAKTFDERSFQTTFQSSDPALSRAESFGGLRWALANASANGRKYQVSAKAIVDFRGRT